MMKVQSPIFVGFFPKLTKPAPDWLSNKSVKEICSVSNCISEGPQDWIAQWKHNALGFYDSENLAYQIVDKEHGQFEIYAYKMFPLRCIDEKMESVNINAAPGNVPNDYEFLGYDIVTKSGSDFFECSPLSCNHGAEDYEVNEFCLIGDQEMACNALLEMSQDGNYEPGPYYLFAVYRKKKACLTAALPSCL